MSRARSFDWDEAARLHAAGATYRELAELYGKSYHGIRYALDAEFRGKLKAASAEWQRAGTCPDCGCQTNRHYRDEPFRCRECAGKHRRAVRGDEAWCCGCRAWLPQSAFARAGGTGRGLRNECRSCDTDRRRAYRRAHPEVEAAAVKRQKAARRARHKEKS